jgi:hypothetical protein
MYVSIFAIASDACLTVSLSGYAAAAKAGWMHRDISDGNIWIHRDEDPEKEISTLLKGILGDWNVSIETKTAHDAPPRKQTVRSQLNICSI